MKLNLDFEAPVAEIEKMLEKLKSLSKHGDDGFSEQVRELEDKVQKRRKEIYENLTPWQTVQIARHKDRPILRDYIRMIFTDFTELHGDRRFSDDTAMIGGFAHLGKLSVMIIGQDKGRKLEEKLKNNFGMAKPDGYRKAMRLMKLAQRFNIPIITFIDTNGAFPGLEAEERGQAEAIAENLTEMAKLTVPVISVVLGEGGSGGALGIGVTDSILMLSHSIYSVISPEGCASILWRDGKEAPRAAEALKITAPSLIELGVIDGIIEEPVGGAHNDPEATAVSIKETLEKHLKRLRKLSTSRLLNKRFDKYSNIGKFNK